jgi:hypothetical protein
MSSLALAGVNDQGQISRMMVERLEGQGLVENTGGQTQGTPNDWGRVGRC